MSDTIPERAFALPKVARPEWVEPSVKDVMKGLKLLQSGNAPEVLQGFFLRTAAMRLLRCVYGSDEATVEAITQHARAKTELHGGIQ